MKVKLIFLSLLCAVSYSYAQTTYVPDGNFENYLETHDESGNVVTIGDPMSMGNGIANDDYVLTVNINSVQNLDVSNKGIADLTGIEDFTNLSSLDCSFNLLTNINLRQNAILIYLFCQNNDLIQIDLSQNPYLTDLYCQNNQIEALELQHNNGLFQLRCDNNQLKVLNIQNGNNNYNSQTFGAFTINTLNNPDLACIQVDDATFSTNNWSDIDATSSFSTNCDYTVYVPDDNFETYLETHNANGIAVPFGDLSNMGNAVTFNPSLDDYVYKYKIEQVTHLDVSNKNIADLRGINSFDALETLICAENQLSLLDVAQNTALTSLSCDYNQLSILNVKNTNNTNFTYFSAINNSNLTCIQVDDDAYSTANWTSIDLQSYFSNDCNYLTYVPDDYFEYYLETHDANGNIVAIGAATSMGNGIAYDDFVITANINAVINLDISNKNISDLTGIEGFVALEVLACYSNQLNSLDVTQNTALTSLYCRHNQLTSLDVTQNTALTELYIQSCLLTSLDVTLNTALTTFTCNSNQLTSLDLSQNTALTTLDCGANRLTNLDVSNNTDLLNLACSLNLLTSLDLTQNIALTELNCYFNQLTNLDLTQNTNLIYFDCSTNQLSSLDLRQNTDLTSLGCANNQLTSLDLTQNTALAILECGTNPLTSLDVKNGNNINLLDFNTTNNPNLTCIQVDDDVYSTANWINIDSYSYFSIDCGYIFETYVPDDNFENYLETHNAQGLTVAFGDPTSMGNQIANDDYVTTASINTVTMLDVYGLYIADATGLEDFELLEDLNFSENSLTSLDVSQNLQLTKLICSRNSLSNLDVTNNTSLTVLYSSDHQMISIDLSQNTLLTFINLGNGKLTSLDLSQNTLLTTLYCWNNFITGLDLSTHSQLTKLKCQNNRLNQLNVQNGNNQNVTEFDIRDNVDLLCVQVDEQQYSEDYWFDKDRDTYYDNNCGYLGLTEKDKTTFSFYPNPIKDELTISIQKRAFFSIIHVNGQIVKQGNLESGENKINTSSLSNGFYIIKITIEGQTLAKKVYKK
jgi:Leucine-rich repeat (LRR) protein